MMFTSVQGRAGSAGTTPVKEVTNVHKVYFGIGELAGL